MRWKPHLRTVLLIVNLVILLLPLGGIALLRLAENQFVRQTEAELIGQGVLVAAAFEDELLEVLRSEDGSESPEIASTYGRPLASPPATPETLTDAETVSSIDPVLPRLDFSHDAVRPPAPDALPPWIPPDPYAVAAGKRLRPLLKGASRHTLAGIRVVDFRGTVVATTGTELGMSLSRREEVDRALKGEQVNLLRERVVLWSDPPPEAVSRGNRVRVFVAFPVKYQDRIFGAVVLSRTPLDIAKALYFKRYHLVVAGLIILGAAIVVSIFSALTITRPVKGLIKQAEKVSRGETGGAWPLEKPGTREVARLSEAVARMAVTLQKRAEYINTFASNVSHEFKTPLTSMRGSAELLQEHFSTMTEVERTRFLKMLEDDLDRLDTLVGRLLDLARADVVQTGNDRADVAAVMESVVHRFAENGLSISTDCGHDAMKVTMAPETLESLLTNLLENARRHGGENVHVRISTRSFMDHDAARVELAIRDNGPGISESNRSKVFRPFFTTSRQEGGTGMGLSIVRALVSAHGGTITLESESEGAAFKIVLPAED
jgi:signal transduction histidine kinase